MGVMIQTFYWDCPRLEGKEYTWWKYIAEELPGLAQVGFNALWLPPAHKAANLFGPSMGYDPYDYYDLGEFNQRGSIKTWFGSRKELLDLIKLAHTYKVKVIADMVINHNNGADAQEVNPLTGHSRWTSFQPQSGRFPRTWEHFHPNCYESWDESTFGDMPDLSHRNPVVYAEILALARWLVEEIGFDGFRYDFVKGYGFNTIAAIQEYRYERDGVLIKPYGVAEFWDNAHAIERWVEATNFSNSNPVDAFDFPLRELLKSLCDQYGFNLRWLVDSETLLKYRGDTTVTFVENHDLRDEGRPIVNDKLLAYSFIFSHEGYPCVFWKDYFNDGLALAGTPNGIDALVDVHNRYAGGTTQVLHVDNDLYIMQRNGYHDQPGLLYVLNNRGDEWNGAWVDTQWHSTVLKPRAWWSAADRSRPHDQGTDSSGWGRFYAPPRGYAVYTI